MSKTEGKNTKHTSSLFDILKEQSKIDWKPLPNTHGGAHGYILVFPTVRKPVTLLITRTKHWCSSSVLHLSPSILS